MDADEPIPLDYATPRRRTTQRALRNAVEPKVAGIDLPPEPAPNRIVLWLIFFCLFAVALICVIMLHR